MAKAPTLKDFLVKDRKINRFSSGIFSLDIAIGGGIPRGRSVMFVGRESSGKTTLATKISSAISKFDWDTGEYGGFTRTLYIDMENTFDETWARKLGWDDRNHIVIPDNGDQASDIITEAIECGDYGLIVADSLDVFYPGKFDERLEQDGGLPGARAQLLNRGFVKWTGKMRKMSRMVPAHKLPTLVCINQYRLAIGSMFSDPRVIPGGEGQRFYNSIICSLNTSKISNVGSVESGMVEINGTFIKNKTDIPKTKFSFKMGLRDNEELKVGEVDNFKGIFDILKVDQIRKEKSKWTFLGDEYKTQNEIKDRIQAEPEFFNRCWSLALDLAMNSGVSKVSDEGDDDDNY